MATMKKLTPVLMVEAIEPVLPFWVERLGFEKTVELPHGDRLGFVILVRDGVEIMYQTVDSVRADVTPLADRPTGSSFLFVEVEDLDAIERALADVKPVVPRRQTFYGADELIVQDPAGNAVTFAKFGEQQES